MTLPASEVSLENQSQDRADFASGCFVLGSGSRSQSGTPFFALALALDCASG
jgi:hypothetical protein